MNADELAQRAAEAIRQTVGEAERRAREIVQEAEEQARRIRAEAEREARERLDQVRRSLAELEKGLGASAASEHEPPVPGTTAAEPATQPAPPEPVAPTPPTAELSPREAPPPAPERALESAPEPAAPEPSRSGDSSSARLVAMKLALDGTPRDQAREQLAADYELPDLDAMLEEVYAKASK